MAAQQDLFREQVDRLVAEQNEAKKHKIEAEAEVQRVRIELEQKDRNER